MYDALKNTKVGDFLAVYSSSTRKTTKHEVMRTTATQVIIGTGTSEVRFTRKHGSKVTSVRWNGASAEPWTAKHDEHAARAAVLAEQVKAADAALVGIEAGVSALRQAKYMSSAMPPEDHARFIALCGEVEAKMREVAAVIGKAP